MDKGVLTIEPTYSDSDFKIKWEDIKEMKTFQRYLITLSDGRRINGYFRSSGDGMVFIAYENGADITIRQSEVVTVNSVDSSFLSRISANIDFGFSLTKANNQRQLNGNFRIGYIADTWSTELYYNTLLTAQDDVEEENGLEKHVMRYPQIFATKAIENKLENGLKKGIIWHTQGLGKTALTYFNVKHLTDYYQKKNTIPKFYFIVDRIDLLNQAAKEFGARGLVVHKVNSREEFTRDIKSTNVIYNSSGKAEITVVNIQKFKDDPDVIKNNDYNLSVQRVFFLDEVNRSYNPKGSFLANLELADKNSIKIELTGTPLLGKEYNYKTLFGELYS